MKIHSAYRVIGLLTFFLFSYSSLAAGLLKPTNSHLPDLKIREHHVKVVMEDGYATTTIDQVFFNPNGEPLEAIYSFPVPESSAVGEFIYWINGQPVIGEVVEKQKARDIYQQQKVLGNDAALVEKDSYKTFDISVAAVPSNTEVKIRLVYIQHLEVDTGIGRYVYPLEDGGVDEEKLAFWTRNETVEEKFSFNLRFRSSYPVDGFRLPKHPGALISQVSETEWTVNLANTASLNNSLLNKSEENSYEVSRSVSEQSRTPTTAITLNQDIVVYWRQQEGLPAALDLVTYKEEKKQSGTFMLTLTPGDDLQPVSQGSDWIFVLDVSGSMAGKYATLVEGVRQGLGKLRPEDRFKVVLFNNDSRTLTQGFQPVSEGNVDQVLMQLEHFQVGGGTNLYSGLARGLSDLDDDRPAGIILVTDGVANVGNTEKKSFLSLLQQHDVRLFTFIMGNSANRPLLQEMTEVSNGFALSVSNADDIVGKILLATSKLTHQAFRNVELEIKGVKAKEFSHDTIGTLYRGEQLVVFGHYWKPGKADVSLKVTVGGEQKTYRTQVEFPKSNLLNPELERLWAFASIEQLQSKLDYFGSDRDVEQAITDIALEYGLVTDYTSMIVLQEEVFQQLNIDRKNQQRVDTEQKAREQRQSTPVTSHRADAKQPMFSSPRPSSSGSNGGSGAGAISMGWLLLIALLGLSRIHSRKRA